MLKPGGYIAIVDPDFPMPQEHDTITCFHCQRVIFVKPGTGSTVYLIPHKPKDNKDVDALKRFDEEPGAFCRVCMHAICLRCFDKGVCTPWERQMEIAERRDRFLRAVGV